jgi:hypothetical protein
MIWIWIGVSGVAAKGRLNMPGGMVGLSQRVVI